MNDDNLTPFTEDDNRASEAGKKSTHGVSLKKALIDMLIKEIEIDGKLTPDNIVKACALHGMKGNSAMMKLMFEYLDGKPDDNLNVNVDFKEVQEKLKKIFDGESEISDTDKE